MLTILLSLLSSSGFGSVIGLAGGIINRFIDIKAKQGDREFELQKMDKEREYMKEEYAMRLQVSTVEAEAVVESKGYEALAASYDFARTSREDGWVDKVSKVIRPLLTLAFFTFTVYVFYSINKMIMELGISPTREELYSLWKTCIEWIFFQAGVSIGWWFAMRPGRSPSFGGK